ncbi:MAG: ATP-binding cassette domain-containing protein, partial [Acidimicrobiaceae bacterium]
MGEELVRVEDVYKIFGPQPRGRAFELSQGGMGKGEVHARTGHVIGLRDVNFNVKRGEIFVIMGLSGSGKSTAIRTVNKLL